MKLPCYLPMQLSSEPEHSLLEGAQGISKARASLEMLSTIAIGVRADAAHQSAFSSLGWWKRSAHHGMAAEPGATPTRYKNQS